ncbi:hypothetical protein ACLOJK_038371 [Asimina triloba]
MARSVAKSRRDAAHFSIAKIRQKTHKSTGRKHHDRSFSPDLQQTNGQQAGEPWHPRQNSSNDRTHPDLGRSSIPPDQCHSSQAADAAHPVQRSTCHARTAHLANRIETAMAACSSRPRHSATQTDQRRASRRHHSSRTFHIRSDLVKHKAEIPAAH